MPVNEVGSIEKLMNHLIVRGVTEQNPATPRVLRGFLFLYFNFLLQKSTLGWTSGLANPLKAISKMYF